MHSETLPESRCILQWSMLPCFCCKLRARSDTDLKCPVIIANSEEMLNISFWLHVGSAVESLWSRRACRRPADAHKHGLCFAITEWNLKWMRRGVFGWQDNLRGTLPLCEIFCSLDWCAFSSLQSLQSFSELCPCGSAGVLQIGIKIKLSPLYMELGLVSSLECVDSRFLIKAN